MRVVFNYFKELEDISKSRSNLFPMFVQVWVNSYTRLLKFVICFLEEVSSSIDVNTTLPAEGCSLNFFVADQLGCFHCMDDNLLKSYDVMLQRYAHAQVFFAPQVNDDESIATKKSILFHDQ